MKTGWTYKNIRVPGVLFIASGFFLQIATLGYFLSLTKDSNDFETNAVISLESYFALAFVTIVILIFANIGESNRRFRLLSFLLFLLIPAIYFLLICVMGNPLYKFAIP